MAPRTWPPPGGPWQWGAPVEYHRDMCPRTLDLLGRAVHLHVNPLLSDEDVAVTIHGLNKVLRSVAEAEQAGPAMPGTMLIARSQPR